jgi:hypothetical protein
MKNYEQLQAEVRIGTAAGLLADAIEHEWWPMVGVYATIISKEVAIIEEATSEAN